MGFTLPPPRTTSGASADHVRALMARKDAIEAEIEAQFSILQSNSVTMDTPLVDAEGFPRADIDVWAVRTARVRIIELRNDHKGLMDNIMAALQDVYSPDTSAAESTPTSSNHSGDVSPTPFAKVDGVAPGSPAASAVCAVPVHGPCFTDPSYRGSCVKISSCHLDRSRSRPS